VREADVAIIEAHDLTKEYQVSRRAGFLRRTTQVVRALDAVSFDIEQGEIVGYLGPNGAGKSTTIKMLTGILSPTAGTLRVAGYVPFAQRKTLARHMGTMFGQRSQLWWDLPLLDSFDMLRRIYAIPEDRYRANVARFREILDLDEFLHSPVRQLSLGQRVRGELVAAMLHDPKVLFLDEPTIGLDVVVKHRIRQFLLDLNAERGTTMILTTHDLTDLERLCRRLIMVDHGRILYDGTVEGLVAAHGSERVLVVDLAESIEPLDIAGTTVVRVEGPRQWIRFDRDAITAARLIAMVSERASLVDVSVQEPAIEDVIREFQTGRVPLAVEPRGADAGAGG
jgi:ABC-2 type transport system ATP-binding protein